jgi:hypothetical protein
MINYWAVLLSAIAAMVIGSIWWGPLFGKMWMEANHFNDMSAEQKEKMKKSMNLSYFQQFVLSLITGWVLAHILAELGYHGIGRGMGTAAILWLGFVFPLQYGETLWSGKKMKVVAASLGASLLTMLVAGLIIGGW